MATRTPRALALGATIAFGSCQLAALASLDGCDTVSDPPTAPLATTERGGDDEPSSAANSTASSAMNHAALNHAAEHARLGDVALSPGFTPDPSTWSGTTTGGPIDLETLDDRCRGWVDPEPDLLLRTTRPFAELVVMAASTQNTTLALAGPSGELRCGNDEDGEHPVVRGYFAPGVYRVWVGTITRGTTARFELAVSEFDDSRPSSLLH